MDERVEPWRRDLLLRHRSPGVSRSGPGAPRCSRNVRRIWGRVRMSSLDHPCDVEAEPVRKSQRIGGSVPADELATELEHVRKWPPDKLAPVAFPRPLRTIGERNPSSSANA